jgi:hypothetical protein
MTVLAQDVAIINKVTSAEVTYNMLPSLNLDDVAHLIMSKQWFTE